MDDGRQRGEGGGKGKGSRRDRGGRRRSVGGSGGGGKKALSAANKTIGKKNPASTSPGLGARRLTRNTSSEGLTIGGMGPGASPSGARPAAGSPDMVRGLVGVPLTRSRSERARLLALAKDVMADGGAAGGVGLQCQPTRQCRVFLQRSAASQLALDLGAGWRFSSMTPPPWQCGGRRRVCRRRRRHRRDGSRDGSSSSSSDGSSDGSRIREPSCM